MVRDSEDRPRWDRVKSGPWDLFRAFLITVQTSAIWLATAIRFMKLFPTDIVVLVAGNMEVRTPQEKGTKEHPSQNRSKARWSQ